MMTPEQLIEELARQPQSILSCFEGVVGERARWKPSADRWSMLEVLGHLIDEERRDFRARVQLTLEDGTQPWPPIDPESWVREESYNERDLGEALETFASERQQSLAWLNALYKPDWNKAHVHPQIGELKAGDLLAAWVSHDLRHLRQLSQLKLDYLDHCLQQYSTRYAAP